ncbi:MAG: UvrD-helicase domain-containing protein [Bdellovibrionales bacterium]|nr:UvrD-helicase domain-containing protein [Bdellovibrionales bacterium]
MDSHAQVIRASAGTGKTFSLTNHLMSLLAQGAQPEEILATTFTKKAAGEILERVFKRLSAAALDLNEAEELRRHLKLNSFDQAAAAELLKKLVVEQHRLTICTLDSFFIKVARAYSLELGLPLAWRIIEEVAAHEMLLAAIGEAISRTDIDVLSGLMALLHDGEVRHSVHGAIEGDISRLLSVFRESGAAAWNSLRVPKGLSKDELLACIAALESLQMPLTQKGEPNKRWISANDNALSCVREGDWVKFISQGLASKIIEGESAYFKVDIGTSVLEAYQPLIKHASSVLLRKLKEQTLATLNLLQMVSEHFEALKLSSAGLRFDDVKYLLSENSLTEHAADIYFRLDSRIKHLLLDEFQDTSRSEWSVIRPIVEEILSKASAENSFFCVGDVKQAIYGWRGGVSEIFNEFESGKWELEHARLDVSYRSAPEVIEAVNAVFSEIEQNPVFAESPESISGWAADFTLHQTKLTQLAGRVVLRTLPEPVEDPEQEAAAEIARCVQQIVEVAPESSVAVLVRRNRMIPRIMMELKRLQIDASEEGGNPVHDSPYVAIVLSLIELADFPDNTVAAFHVATSELGKALGFKDASNSEERLRFSFQLRRELGSNGCGKSVLRWCSLLAPVCGRRDRLRLEQLVELAFRFERDAGSRPKYFADYVRSTRVALPTGSPVRVMTIHQSKGLEFDSVVLADIDTVLGSGVQRSGVLLHRADPLSEPDCVVRYPKREVRSLVPTLVEMYEQACAEELRESLSVLYVALTRAVHSLTILIPSSKNRRGNTFADVLVGALARDVERAPDRVLYESGSTDWARTWQGSSVTPTEHPDAHPLNFATAAAPRRFERKRASLAARGVEEVFAYVENREARRRGTAFHAMLEHVEWIEDDFTSGQLSAAVRGVPGGLGAFAEELFAVLSKGEMKQVLSTERYVDWKVDQLQVFNELPYSVLSGSELLSGKIDRVVVGSNGGIAQQIEILDYKTGGIREEDQAKYAAQMEAYREAVSHLFACRPDQIAAGLLYLDEGRFIKY